LIEIDLAAWIALFPQAREMAVGATALRCVLGRSTSWEELVEAIHVGFNEGAGVRLDLSELTPQELSVAQTLVQKQYGTSKWTFRR
jgi:lipoate-protein ligase A